MTVTGTLIDHGRVVGKPLHRQDTRKGGAPEHTVLLPRFGVESLTALVGESGMDGPVFANRAGAWMSLANMRRALRAALPEDLSWVTPHSFRRTVPRWSAMRTARRWLSSSSLTPSWRRRRRTTCNGRRAALMSGRRWRNSLVSKVTAENIRKLPDLGHVAELQRCVSTGTERARRDSNP